MTKEIKISMFIACVSMCALSVYWFMPTTASTQPVTHFMKERIILPQYDEKNISKNIPEVASYLNDIDAMIRENKSVLPLENRELDSHGKKVQQFLLKNKSFLVDTKENHTLLHNDMMRILPAIVSSLDTKIAKVCATTTCYQAEKYNYVTNTTTRAIVDVEQLVLLDLERYTNMQPDISLRLTHIAQAIALHSLQVEKALGFTPRKKDMSMANVRGTMKESPCENTTHLCVAPTFADHKKEQALWAVVDLTELKLAAAKWAGLGKTTTPACIGERSLQNRYIMENFCQKDTYLEKNGWKITYRLTGSDGLEIRDVSFHGKPVVHSAKIVDWHVSYQEKGAENLDMTTETYIEGRRVEFVKSTEGNYLFGYNDAMGCPLFSTSVVLAFNGPQVRPLPKEKGFMLTQDFRNPKWPMACNYRYENRFEFYDDGSFRVVGVNKGRGCGDHALYRPVMRIDMAVAKEENFYSYDGTWNIWEKEAESLVVENRDKTPYSYKITDAKNKASGYYIEANHGQFNDGSRGDYATIFASKYKPNEGDKDLLTLGSCCDLKNDGVESYIKNEESIVNANIVLWYVPRIHNDTRKGHEYCWADTRVDARGNLAVEVWPCTVGPKFVPIFKENK